MAMAVATKLVRTIYPHGSVRRVIRGPGTGIRFRVQPSMGMTYALGYDTHNAVFLRSVVRPGMTVYDIGANYGQVALPCSRWVGPTGKVVAVEPVPSNVQRLTENLAMNRMDNVTVVHAAASETAGTAVFLLDPNKARMGKLEDCEPSYNDFCKREERFEVRTVVLDELVAQRGDRPDVLKIDVEGGAARVLAGASNTLKQYRPSIYIELHGPEERAAVRDLIRNHGYRLTTLDGRIVDNPTTDLANPLWCQPARD